MPEYTLIYFDVKGLAEPSRYMFALAGVKYEDRRVEFKIDGEEWMKLKPTLTLGQLPILEVDGKQLAQSFGIHRFLASELGFYGPAAWDRAQVDVIVETLREAVTAPQLRQLFFETDEAKRAELVRQVETEYLEKNLANLEKLLRLNNGGDGWFVGDKVSLADVQVYNLYRDFYPGILKKQLDWAKYEKLGALLERFEDLPQVAAWVKERPQTDL